MDDLSMTKNGTTVKVRVNTTFDGRFEATVGDMDLHAPTWPDLEKLVDKATKRVSRSVSIPFTMITTRTDHSGKVTVTGTDGAATGLHSGNWNVLARVDGSTTQYSGWDTRNILFSTPVNGHQLATYRDLLQARRDATTALNEWEKDHRIDLKTLVAEALDKGSVTDD